MFLLHPTAGPGVGMRVREQRVDVIARAAFEAGDIVMFDLGNTDGDVADNNVDGGDDSGWGNIIDPALAQEAHGLFAIAPAAIADNDEAEVIVSAQKTNAFVHTAGGGSAALYDELMLDTAVEANALTYDAPAATENRKVIGIALAIVTTPTTPTLGAVAFDGINGFGHVFTET